MSTTKKLTDLSATTTPPSSSLVYIVDPTDTSQDPTGSSKKVTLENVLYGSSTALMSDSTNKRFVTDAEKTVIGDTSGENTGDQTLNSLLPTQSGNNGKFLTTDGTDASWGTPAGGGGSGDYGTPGVLRNGKIAVSVVAGDLTVSLKTLAGTTPTALDPILVRIGDTEYSIESAIEVEAASGTNWLGLEDTVTTMNVFDLFVYLYYQTDATAGVKIGFSRIPYVHSTTAFFGINEGGGTTQYELIHNGAPLFVDPDVKRYDIEIVGKFTMAFDQSGDLWTLASTTGALTENPDMIVSYPTRSSRVFYYTPTFTGFSTPPSSGFNYQINDCELTIFGSMTDGSSNATTLEMTVPFNAYSLSSPITVTGTAFNNSAYSSSNLVLGLGTSGRPAGGGSRRP